MLCLGAGSGGSSTAYYIAKFRSPCQEVNITVYERSDYVGGRSRTVNVYDDSRHPAELGASIFVKANRNLFSAAQEFGLTIEEAADTVSKEFSAALGVWDGKEFVFVQMKGARTWWDLARLLWKYGLDPIRTQQLTAQTMSRFLKMYSRPYFPFRSLSQTARDLGLSHITSVLGTSFLKQNQIMGAFTTDIIQASTRVNYAQNIGELHGLETMVCMATDEAMSIKGGNWQIFAAMLEAAQAHLVLNNCVSSVTRQPDGTYTISSRALQHSRPSGSLLRDNYDTVVLASPLQFSSLNFAPRLARPPVVIEYVDLHVTLLTTPHRLSAIKFNIHPTTSIPEVILTTLPNRSTSNSNRSAPSGFFSISTMRTIENVAYSPARKEYLYKIFSATPLNASFLGTLFDFLDTPSSPIPISNISKRDIGWSYEKVWHSYPYLHPRKTFEDIELAEDLWYTSGIESFISSMETSSLMGMNIARLIVDRWENAGAKWKGKFAEEDF